MFEITEFDDSIPDVRHKVPDVICDECRKYPIKAEGTEFYAYYCTHQQIYAEASVDIKHHWILHWPVMQNTLERILGIKPPVRH